MKTTLSHHNSSRCGIVVLASLLSIVSCATAGDDEGLVNSVHSGLRPIRYQELPFDLSRVESINHAALSQNTKLLLSQNGFVVVGPRHGNMPDCYPSKGLPLVTIDSVLEVFLSDFEIAWGAFEGKQAERFARVQIELWDALVTRFERLPEGAARAAGHRLLALVAVGRSLSDPGWTIPDRLPDEVDAKALKSSWQADLALVNSHTGISESALWLRTIDWSVFRPVGSYADDEAAANYYRVSQWWGRQGLRTAERDERLCAGILMWILEEASPREPGSDGEDFGFEGEFLRAGPLYVLNQIEEAYDEFFDAPDDLTPLDLLYSRRDPSEADGLRVPEDLGTDRFDEWLLEVFEDLRVPEGFHEWDIADATPDRHNGQGLRLLAPRTTTASHVFNNVTYPHVPQRLLPSGLDLLAVLGDDRAKELTLEVEQSPEVRGELAEQIDALRAENGGHALTFPKSIDQMCAALANPRQDDRYPLFARTPAYRDRSLASALACWAGAREIYGVRVLSGGGVGGGDEPSGFADPNLEGWQSLIELCHVTSRAFGRSQIEFDPTAMDWALTYRRLAEKQLRGESLSGADRYHFLHYFMELHNAIGLKIVPDGDENRFPEIDRRVAVEFGRSRMPDVSRYAGKACCRMYAIVEYDGRLYLCQGGVFDYCEFDRPSGSSISRTEFRELMDSENAPLPPAWTNSYRVNE